MTAPAPTYVQDNAASVRGRALRVTQLGQDGAPITGTSCDVYLTGGFISFQFTPEYSEGDEIEVKNAAGETCVYYKLPDTLKNVGLQLSICDPDPVLTQMLVGGEVLTAAGNSAFAPAGTAAGDLVAVGYASEMAGSVANPNGVAVEVWADAIVNGRSASRAPFWHYLFPSASFRMDGDRVIENGNLATQFAGTGVGNEAFGTGPNMDLAGVTPTPPVGAFDWRFPAYTDRPFLYTRSFHAPLGLKGAFANLGIEIVGIVSGDPATYNPANATRPANLTDIQSQGALGQTDAWDPGEYVILRDNTEAYWDGDSWVEGRAPGDVVVASGATAGTPGTYTPTGAQPPDNLDDTAGLTASPTTAWTTGQRIVLGDATTAYWNGTAWVAGTAP
jgi:hypothetical protein